MERHEVQKGIRESWAIVVDLKLAETISSAAPLRVNEKFRDLLFSEGIQYSELYLAGLELQHFNILLTDFSFFQYSFSDDDHVRYAYYPNPFVETAHASENIHRLRELVEAELITGEEFLAIVNEQRNDNRAAPIRYENAPGDRKPFSHPCSHFHIGHGVGGRWALSRHLTPLAFTLLVLKHYYAAQWQDGESSEEESGNVFEARLIRARAACEEVGETLFSALEKKCFHFS
jgi:hypothetical protein